MSGLHILAVFDGPGPSYKWEVTCPTTVCGYTECSDDDPHPDCAECVESGDECPYGCGEDDREFHGVMHTHYGSWTVPFDGCVVSNTLSFTGELPDDLYDRATRGYRTGSFLVHDEWDDEYMTLHIESEIG